MKTDIVFQHIYLIYIGIYYILRNYYLKDIL